MKRLLLTPLAALAAAGVFAQEATSYQCTFGELTRRVDIVYETGVQVPCEVQYYKVSEAPGETQVLWRALNEAGYCEARTREFIARLEGMGWNCGGVEAAPEEAAPATTPAPAEEDDTDALAPAEDIELTENELQP
jgi:hypothetical protein